MTVALALGAQALHASANCPSVLPPVQQSVAGNVLALTAADMNGDNAEDIVVATDANTVIIYIRGAGATYTPHVIALAGRPSAVATGDFDNNGTQDLVVVESGSRVQVILLDSNFLPIGGTTLITGDNPVAVAVGDIAPTPGDGNLDIVVANLFSNDVSVFLGHGDGTFLSKGNYPAGPAPSGIAIADFNGDGKQDVVVTNFGAGTVSVLQSDGNGKLDQFGAPLIFAVGTDPMGVTVGDFNGDTVPDIATANFGSGNVSVILGHNSGGNFNPSAHVDYAVGLGPVAITAAKIDNNAQLDLVVSNSVPGSISVLAGQAAGTFASPNTQPVNALVWNVSAAQFDGTGLNDVVTGNLEAPSFSILLNGCGSPPFVFTVDTGIAAVGAIVGPIAGGQTVRVVGHFLTGTTSVTFGGVPVQQILSVADDAVTVITPPHAEGFVEVAVDTPSGHFSYPADYPVSHPGYYYAPGPVVSLSPASGFRGGHQSITINSNPTFLGSVVGVKFGAADATITQRQSEAFTRPLVIDFVKADSPASAINGPVNVTVLAANGSASATFTYVNQPPSAIPQTVTMNEDTFGPITIAGTDGDNDPLTYAITAQPTKGTLSGTPPNLAYYPNLHANGADSFRFTVNDGTVTSGPAIVTINITPVDVAPVAVAQLVSSNEDTPVAITLTGTDVDGPSLVNFLVNSSPTKGTLTGTTPNLMYTPNHNVSGSDSFTFTVSDGTLTSAPGTIMLAIAPVNHAPVATAQSVTARELAPLNIVLAGTDIDGDGLGFTIVTPPSNGTLSGSGASRVYTPNAPGQSDSFTFTVNDGQLTSAPASVSIAVLPAVPVMDDKVLLLLGALLAAIGMLVVTKRS